MDELPITIVDETLRRRMLLDKQKERKPKGNKNATVAE